MINPNELHIGNLVFCTTANLVVKVQWPHPAQLVVDIKGPYVHSPHTHGDLEEFEPIPLTSEWLERCGFYLETVPDSIDEDGDIIEGYTHWTNSKFCFHFENGCIAEREHIKYVHLLQNWYYFSKGEELTIKETV